jgi:hypothetical protein
LRQTFDFRTERGNDAFPEMIRDNVWEWVRPNQLIDTNWADRNKDGIDGYPDSMLAGRAKLTATSHAEST